MYVAADGGYLLRRKQFQSRISNNNNNNNKQQQNNSKQTNKQNKNTNKTAHPRILWPTIISFLGSYVCILYVRGMIDMATQLT